MHPRAKRAIRMTHDPDMPPADAALSPAAQGGLPERMVPAEYGGRRLDRTLELFFPGFGLRRLRRVFAEYVVLVDGAPRGEAFRVRAGAVVRLAPPPGGGRQRRAGLPEGLRVIAAGPDYGAVAKPGGLASASIGPGGRESLEDHLPELFPGRTALLLGRLDTATSGIVAVAFSPEAASRFRQAEDRGQAKKTYLAVVQGIVPAPFTARAALDMARRKKTRVLAPESDDPLRHTAVTPLGSDPGTELTLVRADIAKGARHQIRAHLAAYGYPILGDEIYDKTGNEQGCLYLHHARIIFPGFTAVCPPHWTGSEEGSVLVLGPGIEQALNDVVLANEVGP
jgi:23S rRNA pseudouridine1911/1915/1917 synthase